MYENIYAIKEGVEEEEEEAWKRHGNESMKKKKIFLIHKFSLLQVYFFMLDEEDSERGLMTMLMGKLFFSMSAMEGLEEREREREGLINGRIP